MSRAQTTDGGPTVNCVLTVNTANATKIMVNFSYNQLQLNTIMTAVFPSNWSASRSEISN